MAQESITQNIKYLLKRGQFSEARHYIATLKHPKKQELLWQVNLAETKYNHWMTTQETQANQYAKAN